MADPLDPYVRHQVYVEGYKNGETASADATFEEVSAVVLLVVTKLGVGNLGELTKRQMLTMVSDIKAKVKTIFNKTADLTEANIAKFLAADIKVTGQMVEATAGKPIGYGAVNLTWSNVANTPIAGVGVEPSVLLPATLTAMLADLSALVKRGYADSQEVADFTRELVGTNAHKYRDGLINKMKRRWTTAVQTMIQHTSSMVAFKLQSLVSENYTWCAVLDSRTTEICRDRNGRVYAYRNGPRPPAHWNCRSFTVPLTITEAMPTFYAWVSRQPVAIQNDVLGPARARELRTGLLKADDLPGFDRTRPLTVTEYAGKVDQILTEVA